MANYLLSDLQKKKNKKSTNYVLQSDGTLIKEEPTTEFTSNSVVATKKNKTSNINLPIVNNLNNNNDNTSSLPTLPTKTIKSDNNNKTLSEVNLPNVNTSNTVSSNTQLNLPTINTSGKTSKSSQNDSTLLDLAKGVGATGLNSAVQLGKGIVDFSEEVVDTGLQIGSSKYNPFMHLLYKGDINEAQKTAQEIIQRDLSQEFLDKLGYSNKLSNGKTVQETLDSNSLVKSDNLGGQVLESVGQMLPSLMVGTGAGEAASLGTMAVGSYGGSLETAYNEGATRSEANRYALMSAAIEVATEKMFAGVGGVIGTGALDDVVKEKLTSGISNKILKTILESGLDATGEGLEEVVSDLLQPIAQKLTYASDKDLKELYKNQDMLDDFLAGALSSVVMQGMTAPVNKQSNIKYNEIENTINNEQNIEEINNKNSQIEELPINSTNNIKNVETSQNNRLNENILPTVETEENNNNNTNLEDVIEQLQEKRNQSNSQQEIQQLNNQIEELQKTLDNTTDDSNTFAQDNKTITFDTSNINNEDLSQSSNLSYQQKTNGDVLVTLTDSNGNLINEFSVYNQQQAEKYLGKDISSYIYQNANSEQQSIQLENNTPEIEYSNSFKDQQLKIINDSNPMEDSIHTGIRSTDDIKTFQEAYEIGKQQAKNGGWNEYASYPDITNELIEKAIDTGSITVYSSNNIENGTFVTPSYEQALEYAGMDKNKVKSKTVNLNDVAWINLDEGQYAKVNSVANNQNINYNKNEGDINDRRSSNRIINENGKDVGGRFRSIQGFNRISDSIQESDGRASTIKQNYGDKESRKEYLDRVKNNKPKILTKEQIEVQKKSKELGVDIQFFLGEDNAYLLGTTYNGVIYLDVNPKNIVNETSNLEQRFYHELFHNIKRNKTLGFSTEIKELQNDVFNYNFESLNEYVKNRGYDDSLFLNQSNTDKLYAEEVLADYAAKHLANYNVNYKVSEEIEYRLNSLLDDAINAMKLNQKNSNKKIAPVKEEKKTNLPDSEFYKNKIKELKEMDYDSLNKDARKLYKEQLQKYEKIVRGNPTKESSYDDFKETKKTRKTVQQELQKEMGITVEDLQVGKDINSIDFQRTDPIRLNEKIFGYKVGSKINDATINQTKHNEAERTRFLNQEREDIKKLEIKPRSKESAAVQKYGERYYVNEYGERKPYTDKELFSEFPNVETQEKIKKAAQQLRKKYDNYIDQINDVITELGYDEIPKRDDYMRHFMELSDKLSQWGVPLNPSDLNSDSLPTDINGLTDQFKPGKNWFASAMTRKGLKTTYDAITGIDGYLEGASNLIYHTEDIQRYRALSKLVRDTYGQTHGLENIDKMTEEEAQQRIEDVYKNKLSKYAAWLDEQANALAGKKGGIDRAAERLLGRKIYSVLDTAKKQVGSNMTGFNVRSALTNFASSIQGASKTNKIAFVKGTISTLQNITHDDGLINKSDFLTSRFGSDQLSKKLWQKVSNAGQILMTGSDYFTANQIWRSKYFENLQNGMNESEAIKKADDFSARIMGDRSKGSTAEIFNSKTAGILTQFQLEVNNQWSSIIHDNKMDIKSGNKSGATVLFQLGQLAAMSYLFNNFMKSLTGSSVMIDPIDMLKKIIGDDDDDKTLEERSEEVLGDLLDNLPFVSFLTGGRIPISEAFTGLSTLGNKLTGQTDSYGNEITWDDVKNDAISSAYYWLLPTGYGQIRKTVKGTSMYNTNLPIAGSYTDSGNLRFTADESTGGKIKAALFGQYTNKEAQKYIDSGYKSINKSHIDEMKQLEMSSSEYRDYRNGLTSSGTTNAEKIDYIVNLDNATNKQKNIMASNLLSRDFDVTDYKKYNSYEEYDYAYKNPEKYSVITQITTYDKYNEYKDKIDTIREKTSDKKTATIQYINSLKLNVAQKAIFIKQYYPSYDAYDSEITNYIYKQKDLTKSEKNTILEKLGFTIKNGKVVE
jgi:hypothetical protein